MARTNKFGKLPAELPGKEHFNYIAPLYPAYNAGLMGCATGENVCILDTFSHHVDIIDI